MSDAYNYLPSFFSDDPKAAPLNYDQLQARRKIAMALATRNRPYPKTIGEGLTALGEGIGEAMYDRRTERDAASYQRQADEAVRRLSDPATAVPQTAPAVLPSPNAGQGPMDSNINPFGSSEAPATTEMNALAMAPPDVAKSVPPQAKLSSMSIDEWLQRNARNETGGQPDPYRTIGPQSRRGDFPYGKYQVMGENIPKWSKTYLGKEMTPQEFLDSPDAQEAIARGQGGKYLAKYGPIGAAEAWFAGERGRVEGRSTRKDTLGTHIDEYVRRFNIPLVSRDQVTASAVRAPTAAPSMALAEQEAAQQPVQLASLGGGMPTPDTAPAPEREAIAQALVAQQSPMQAQPMPQQAPPVQRPQQIAQAPRQPIGTPVPSTVTPAQSGPPKMPDQTPMTPREMEILRTIGSTTDPNLKGRLEPIAERMAAERKFKDTQNMELWKKDVIAYEKRTDPMQRAQLEKLQQEQADAVRDRMKTEARGGVSQAVIDKSIEESAKKAAPLREGSIALNEVDDLIENGMFTGTLAKGELGFSKVLQAFGANPDPRVANTERFAAAIAPIVAAARASLAGTANISDKDLEAATKAAGGDITLTKEGLQGIMKTVRTMQTNTARHHQELLATASGGDTAAERTLYGIHGLPMERIVPKNDRSVERLMQNADNEHERGLFNKSWHTPGLAEKIIARERARR